MLPEGQAAAVDQYEGVGRAEATEVDVGALGEHTRDGTVGHLALPLVLAAETDAVVGALRERLRNEARDLAHGSEAERLNLDAVKLDHGAEVSLAHQPADAGAGDLEGLELLGGTGGSRRRGADRGDRGEREGSPKGAKDQGSWE